MSDSEWAGRTVVVTGCSSGIGEEVARRLQVAGADVVGADLRRPALDVPWVALDLADSPSVADAASALPSHIDALFNVAGVSSGIGDPLAVVSVNFAGTRELTELLVDRIPTGGAVCCTSSLAAAGYRGHRDAVLDLLAQPTRDGVLAWCRAHIDDLGNGYGLSKEAIVWYVAQRCVDLASRGIRINATAPGVTETPILRDSIASLGQEYLDAIPRPLGRVATAAEQAAVLIFLAGSDSSFLTGQTLWVDGGVTAGSEAGTLDAFSARR
ncbi:MULTISPECIES: coniferyl-alcohol dehydrogenase [unclassified Microbacterium]|uniref:coniferyl-alcohol dehydrogenase n=1 Tax=unclassified Microbacterium TaxID=2609290 RepID=UPI00301627AB